jgi:hypothetical protein
MDFQAGNQIAVCQRNDREALTRTFGMAGAAVDQDLLVQTTNGTCGYDPAIWVRILHCLQSRVTADDSGQDVYVTPALFVSSSRWQAFLKGH